MKKGLALVKASMTDNMNIFKVGSKNNTKLSKRFLLIFITLVCFFSIWSYADIIMEQLIKVHLGFVLLTMFILFTSIITLIEGIYKSSNLLFNCKDDNLLFSLPIKKSTVLFIRIFKFYIFELIYNSLFLLPAIVVYIRYVDVEPIFYLISVIALLLLPIIPIVISCIIGGVISFTSSKFRLKNIAQTVITTIFLIFVLFTSFNLEKFILNINENAVSINTFITKLYYPAGAYINMITDFSVKDLIVFILVHILLFIATIVLLSSVYFKINSRVKSVKTKLGNKKYGIKANRPIIALIKKEFKRFISSPVFVTNAGFGLVLFIIACIGIIVKIDGIVNTLASQGLLITVEQIKAYFPVVLFGLICFTSLMTSITSSMISLEGKSINILKSIPVRPSTIILSKVLAAVIIMIPFILIGDIVLFTKFSFSFLEILMILIASVVLPVVSETIGIIVNLKYPKMDAENDTEVVKQSISSMISVFIGFALVAITGYGLYKCIEKGISIDSTILIGLGIYGVICICLLMYLKKKCVKEFNNINV